MAVKKTVIIAGGGTGGHIYPAVAIAQALIKIDPAFDIHFVGTSRGLENKIIPAHNFPLHLIDIGRLNSNVSLRERLKTILSLPLVLWRAASLVRRLNPCFVLGVGGYASGPVLLMSALLRRPAFIWEANAFPGLANRILAPFVRACFVVFPEARNLLKGKKFIQAGMPVRGGIEAVSPFSFSAAEQLHILVVGGSQGSKALNEVVSQAVLQGGEWLSQVRIRHQTGPADYGRIRHYYQPFASSVQAYAYIDKMQESLDWANLIIARSGISTVAELAAAGRPAVLIPLPTAADNHQQKNAEVLVREQGALMVEQKAFTVEALTSLIRDFLRNPARLEALAKNVKKFHQKDAALKIAHDLIQLSS